MLDEVKVIVDADNATHHGNKIQFDGFEGNGYQHAMLTISCSAFAVNVYADGDGIELYTTHSRDDHEEKANVRKIKSMKSVRTYMDKYLN